MCVTYEHIGENRSESFVAVDLHKIIPVLQYLVSLLVGNLFGLRFSFCRVWVSFSLTIDTSL